MGHSIGFIVNIAEQVKLTNVQKYKIENNI